MEERRDLFSEYLRKNADGQQPVPGDGVWEKISSSLDKEAFDQTLRNGFEDFNAEPSPAVFDRIVNDLDEGRTLSQGFDAWEEALPLPAFDRMRSALNDEVFDHSILESYQEWNGGNSRDLWDKLDENLSREAVWTRLQHSLASYTSSSATWKTIVSIAAMLLLFFHLSDDSDRTLYVNSLNLANTGTADNAVARTSDSQPSLPGSEVNQHVVQRLALKNEVNNQASAAVRNPKKRNSVKLRPEEQRIEENPAVQSTQLAVNDGTNSESQTLEYTYVRSLPGHGLEAGPNSLAVRFPEVPITKARNRFSVEFGPQLAILTERSSDMGTATPGLGFGGGVNYRYHIGPILVSHGVNYSRYNQQCGDYVNGHYRLGDQQLNAVQFNTTAGVELNRFHVYGGLMLSRALSGVEKSGSTVTKVYHFDPIAPGLTAGVNVKLVNFKSSALGTGIQYSWVRGMSTRENSLTNVQGVRMSIFYSF